MKVRESGYRHEMCVDAAKVHIGWDPKSGTFIKINDVDVSSFVTRFDVTQTGGELFPTVSLDIPAKVEMEVKAKLELNFI